MRPPSLVGWIGTTLSLSGVLLQALNLPCSRYSFCIFIISASMWFVNGLLTKNRPLAVNQAVLCLLNIFAVYRWF